MTRCGKLARTFAAFESLSWADRTDKCDRQTGGGRIEDRHWQLRFINYIMYSC
jgi:hypothetical protein